MRRRIVICVCTVVWSLGVAASDDLIGAWRDAVRATGPAAFARWLAPGATVSWPRDPSRSAGAAITGAITSPPSARDAHTVPLTAELLARLRLPVPPASLTVKHLGTYTRDQSTVLNLFVMWTGNASGATSLARGSGSVELVSTPGGMRVRRIVIDSWDRVAARPPLYKDVTTALALVEPDLGGARSLFGDSGTPNLDEGGLAVGDVDADGALDIVAVRDGRPDRLYLQRRNGFVEAGQQRGVASPGHGRGALLFDPDGDGDLDLFVTARGGDSNRHFVNDGRGFFTDATASVGLGHKGSSFCAAAADVDGDDDLDLFVCGYGDTDRTRPASFIRARNGEANLLYLNRGDGTFDEAGEAAGLADTGWSYAAAFADYDADGDQDLYIANDFGSNRLYRNRGDGRFDEVAVELGASDPGNGMSVNWADIDNDGDPDLLVSNMYSAAGIRQTANPGYAADKQTLHRYQKFTRGNTALVNQGGRFTDRTVELGLTRGGWAWGAAVTDLDRDGWLDVYVANGYLTGHWQADL